MSIRRRSPAPARRGMRPPRIRSCRMPCGVASDGSRSRMQAP